MLRYCLRYIYVPLLFLLMSCATPTVQFVPFTATPTLTPSPSLTPTLTPAPTATPSPTLTPTVIPTIVIPMLTPTLTPTATSPPYPVWNIPERVVPETFGVEIHFTRAGKQELDYIARGGFGWVRMDMFWHMVETALGQYDFSDYDVLVAAMEARGIRIVFILDYGNSLYDQGYPPTSPGGMAAFARFAAAAARRYRDRGIIWEIWNEPNLDHFWTPQANAADYARLALRVANAIHRADPGAVVVAPAVCGYEWAFWTTVGQMGLFQRLDAITIHSYGVYSPEEILPLYLTLRGLINRYNPQWKIPILSGEWGFATTQGGMSELQQAQFLTRQWLFNISHDINLSIWYDWHDDGPDPYDPEHHFGIVRHDYTTKASYQAARTLMKTLDGYRFLRRIPLANGDDYLLLFQKEAADAAQVALVGWTTAPAHSVILPIPTDDVEWVALLGDVNMLESVGNGLAMTLSQSPRYLMFRPDQAAAQLGGWRPEDTVNCVVNDGQASIPLIFENSGIGPLTGVVEVRVYGEVRGTLAVAISPGGRQYVRVPVNLTALSGNVQAEIHFVPESAVMLPLQSALIWLQVTR